MRRSLSFPQYAFVLLMTALPLFAQEAQRDASLTATDSVVSAALPRLVKFSGVLKDSDGKPRTGTFALTFSIYREKADSTALWQETQNIKLDDQGRYSALLGITAQGMPVELFASGDAHWLGVRLEQETEQPRVVLVSVPYAMKSMDSESL